MTKNILLLAAVLGFVAQSSVFAADPTPTPSASASPTHYHRRHHKKSNATPAQDHTGPPSVLLTSRGHARVGCAQSTFGSANVDCVDPTLREACRADVEQLGKKPVSTADLQLAVCASPVRVLEFYELLVVDATEPAAK